MKKQTILMDHPNRTQNITLLALVSTPRVLGFKSQYSKVEDPPVQFRPKTNEFGAVLYEVPFEYAERLLRGEPEKYKLFSPKSIKIYRNGKQGGRELATVTAVEPVMEGEEPLRDRGGNIVYQNVDMSNLMAM